MLSWTGDEAYRLFGGFTDVGLVAVAGVSIQALLHHSRHAWFWDLVADESHRGEGYGTELLGFVEDWAAENGCAYVALASPLEKTAVREYYEAREYEKWRYVIETELSP